MRSSLKGLNRSANEYRELYDLYCARLRQAAEYAESELTADEERTELIRQCAPHPFEHFEADLGAMPAAKFRSYVRFLRRGLACDP